MKTAIKRFVAGLAIAGVLVGGAVIDAPEASARAKIYRNDDNKIILICYFDDRTGQLLYCDLYLFNVFTSRPNLAAGLAVAEEPAPTRLTADQIAIDGDRVVVDGKLVDGAPDGDLAIDLTDNGKGNGGKHKGGKGRRR